MAAPDRTPATDQRHAGTHDEHEAHGQGAAAALQEPGPLAEREAHAGPGETHAGHDHHAAHDPDDAAATDGGHDRHAGHEGHDAHAGHGDHAAMFRDRFWLTLVLTIPVVLYSHHLQEWLGYSVPMFPGSDLLAPVLGSIIFFYGGWPFLTGGWQELKSRAPGMMLLIAMAISVAYLASLATSLGWFDQEVWWELALLIAIMLLGHWVEMRAIGQARGALAALAELLPDEAERLTDDGTERVSVAELAVGDVVLVRPGARVPADGVVVAGEADVDESMITGESTPVTRGEGDRVVAATVVAEASLRIEVTATGDDTALAGIQRMVAEAEASRSRSQVLADRAAALLFYVAVAAGALTLFVWSLLGDPGFAVNRTVTVLVIACPHALGLAIPLVTSISTSKAARSGILVKDRLALERMRTVDTVLFDKTGTLTRGEHAVSGVATRAGIDEEELLRLAGAVEADSEHPLARAIHAHAAERVDLPAASGFRSMTGRGVAAEVAGETVAVGGPALLRERGLEVPADVADATTAWRERGAAVLHVVRGDEVLGALALEDEVREVSREAIAQLHEAGVTVAMVTGDAQQVADAVARDLGIDEVFAEVLPEDKDAKVSELQDRGATVAMVGDGVNDAPALARADVGIAIGAGTDVAMESAGIVLASDDPRGVVAIRRLSGATYRKMVQNLWWAAGYNVVALPLAAGVLTPIGFTLPMALGAVLMSTSTVIVALNAQLLRRLQLRTA
jgi:P-type Cu2+ transporter